MVFNSLGGGHTHTYQRFHENHFKKPGVPGLKTRRLLCDYMVDFRRPGYKLSKTTSLATAWDWLVINWYMKTTKMT